MKRKRIFVFGSNLAGRHGKGAARHAYLRHGAIYGQGTGLQGSSYAIPTKDERLVPLGLEVIRWHVKEFLECASLLPEFDFDVTAIGCGLAGYSPDVIAPFFTDAPGNVSLPPEFRVR